MTDPVTWGLAMNEDRATRYHRQKRRSRVAGVVGGGVLLAAFWFSGASVALRDLAVRTAFALPVPASWHHALVVAFYVAGLCTAAELLACPLAVHRGYLLDRRYGLSAQPFPRWMADYVKGAGLALGLALAAASLAYAWLRWWPSWWWVPTGALLVAGTVGLAFLAPILLFPLFFKLRPLGRDALLHRLEALVERAGVPVIGIYEWRLGDRTRAANAALVGLGRTRRILVSDTLLAAYSEDEIEVVLAHELAHHVHGDLWKALAADAVLTTGALGAGHLALGLAAGVGGLASTADVAGLPILLLGAAAWSVATLPLVNGLSRAHERRADRFALELTGNPEAFIAAMRRLGAQNLAEEAPSRVTRWIFHSHPPLPERVLAARDWMRQRAGA